MAHYRSLITGCCFLMISALAGCAPTEVPADLWGYLEGLVTIGPICPVEIPDTPCPVPPEAYAARQVLVYLGRALVSQAEPSRTGHYWIALAPGFYTVDIYRVGLDRSADVPRAVQIRAGETIKLNIAIDTGIR